MVKLVCWNTAYRRRSWCCLRDMDVDVALVQEACNPPQDVLSAVDTGPREHWDPTTVEFRLVGWPVAPSDRSKDDDRETVRQSAGRVVQAGRSDIVRR